jgi:hypothetical protein
VKANVKNMIKGMMKKWKWKIFLKNQKK